MPKDIPLAGQMHGDVRASDRRSHAGNYDREPALGHPNRNSQQVGGAADLQRNRRCLFDRADEQICQHRSPKPLSWRVCFRWPIDSTEETGKKYPLLACLARQMIPSPAVNGVMRIVVN